MEVLNFTFCRCCLLAETKTSEARTMSNSLGKRRQLPVDNVVSYKHSAPHNVDPPVIATACSISEPTALESPSFDDVSYSDSSLPLHVASQLSLESPQPTTSELPQSDQVSYASTSLQLVPALMASLPSQVLQLIHSHSAPPVAASFPSQNAVEASVHPLLSVVQHIIPPLHECSPSLPLSHAVCPSHTSLPTSHQTMQSQYAEAHSASLSVHQSSVTPAMMRTASSATRGISSHVKSLPPTPKVIIVSGTGISSATTIAGPPPAIVTTSVVTKPLLPPTPGYFLFFHYSEYFCVIETMPSTLAFIQFINRVSEKITLELCEVPSVNL